MAINTGVNASKVVAYAVLANPLGVDASKVTSYAALANPLGVDVSKVVAFAVLAAVNSNPPLWGTFTMGNGALGRAYNTAWDMPTAAYPVTYSVLSGSLPTGLSLSAIAGNQAHISGTPTAIGIFSFTLRATNTYGTADQPFSITIATGGGGSYTWIC